MATLSISFGCDMQKMRKAFEAFRASLPPLNTTPINPARDPRMIEWARANARKFITINRGPQQRRK